ncbi:antibiotic acetyltransferase [Rhodococcus rhodochrous]|nr:antibiotic acetyltransferase [Rhodococcus rhodochrous]
MLPFKSRILRLVTNIEGGQLYSASLRSVLQRYHGVEVGAFSYGSLLELGMADRHTRIGRYVSVGPNVRRFGAAHPVNALSMHPFWYNPALGFASKEDDVARTSIEIGHDVWIGANVTILPGCRRIGVGAVVGAGSVVTRDVADFTIVAGNPASVIATRLSPSLREQLVDDKIWNLSPHSLSTKLSTLEPDAK